jgi:hypothetical protein
MQLNEEQLKLAHEWVKTKFTHGPCWICGKEEWSVAPFVWELRAFNQGFMVVGGPVFPVVSFFCTGCGNVVFVSAVAAGIIKPFEAPPQQAAKPSVSQAASSAGEQPAQTEG